jgi:hypothetical protein
VDVTSELPEPWDYTATVKDATGQRYRLIVDVAGSRFQFRFGWALSRAATILGDLPARGTAAGLRLPLAGDADAILDVVEARAAIPVTGLPAATATAVSAFDLDLARSTAAVDLSVAPSLTATPPAILLGF